MHIVMSSSAKMPALCWGQYRRVAVVELADPNVTPCRIDPRLKAIKRIVQTWEKLHVGKTDRCAYHRALVSANMLAKQLDANT